MIIDLKEDYHKSLETQSNFRVSSITAARSTRDDMSIIVLARASSSKRESIVAHLASTMSQFTFYDRTLSSTSYLVGLHQIKLEKPTQL